MKKRKALFMVCLLTVAFGLTALVAVFAEKKEETEGLLCVTSFYPVQLLAEAVTEGAEGVTVRNLTENHSGCIHDYTLTTRDMRLLSAAELFLINGGEMELFLEKAAAEYQDLVIVDTSEGYDFLEGVEHNHEHGTETDAHEAEADVHGAADCTDPDHDHEAKAAECTAPDHDHETESGDGGHSHAINAHIWMDIDGYLLQLSRVEEAFVAADPARAELYRNNAAACRAELMALKEEFATAGESLKGRETVVFHEGFVYLLQMLGMEPVHCLAMDSDTQIAAGEAAEITEECRFHGIEVLFAEAEYAETVSDTFVPELSCQVVVLDPVTSGKEADETSGANVGNAETVETTKKGIAVYCEKMRENLEVIKQAYGLQ